MIQSYLKRSEADIRHLNALGVRVRLVKGAYKEPKTVAYQKKSEVDAAFVDLMRLLLDEGTYPAIATHDPVMIETTKAYAKQKGYAADRFEFQMLYGIRRDLQAQLVKEGYRVRVYVPFGKQWYPVLHAPAGRATRQRRVRVARDLSATRPELAAPVARQGDERVAAGQHRLHVHPLFDAVKAAAGRAKQDRRDARFAQHRGVGPEAHADQGGLRAWGLGALGRASAACIATGSA